MTGFKYSYECPHCGTYLELKMRVTLTTRRCPQCGATITAQEIDRQDAARREQQGEMQRQFLELHEQEAERQRQLLVQRAEQEAERQRHLLVQQMLTLDELD
jgi:phage terminase large subunit GpA-like protein